MTRMTLSLVALVLASPAMAGQGAAPLCYEIIGCVQDRNVSPRDAEKLGCDQL